MKNLTIILEDNLLTSQANPIRHGRQKQFPFSRKLRSLKLLHASLFLAVTALILLFASEVRAETHSFLTVTGQPGWFISLTPSNFPNNTITIRLLGQMTSSNLDMGTRTYESNMGPIYVRKYSGGVQQGAGTLITLSSNWTVASMEPFNFPFFNTTNLVVAMIDIPDLIASGTTFSSGDILNASGGSVSQTPYITFLDASSLGFSGWSAPSSFSVFDGLPGYTGTLTFFGYDSINEVPEPKSIVLLVLGAISLVTILRRRTQH